MSKYSEIRHPFLALPYAYRNMAVPRELMVDYEKGLLYVRNSRGTRDIQLGKTSVLDSIEYHIDLLRDGVSEDGDNMYKIRNLIKEIEDWKKSMTSEDNNNVVDKLSEIIEKFKGIDAESPTLMQMLNNKVDKIPGKGLSTNDLTDNLLEKLNSIDYGANNYKHPTSKQCKYEAPIQSVNNKTGKVILTPSDIGLGNISPNANYYVHPQEKQCNAQVVTSVNNKIGIVKLTNSDIGLSNIKNYKAATSENINNYDNMYLTPDGLKSLIDKCRDGNYTHPDDNFVMVSIGDYPTGFTYNTNYFLSKLRKILFKTGEIINGLSKVYFCISQSVFPRYYLFTTPTFPSNSNGILEFTNTSRIVIQLRAEGSKLEVQLSNNDWTIVNIQHEYRIHAVKESPLPCICTLKLDGEVYKKIFIESLGI